MKVICPRCFSQQIKLINKKKGIYRCVRKIPDTVIKCNWTFSIRDVIKNYGELKSKAEDRVIVTRQIKRENKLQKLTSFYEKLGKKVPKYIPFYGAK